MKTFLLLDAAWIHPTLKQPGVLFPSEKVKAESQVIKFSHKCRLVMHYQPTQRVGRVCPRTAARAGGTSPSLTSPGRTEPFFLKHL